MKGKKELKDFEGAEMSLISFSELMEELTGVRPNELDVDSLGFSGEDGLYLDGLYLGGQKDE